MDASNLQIYWHESQPIYSVSFQSHSDTGSLKRRLVTAGGDNKIRVWQLNFSAENYRKVETIDFLSSMAQHEQAVNVVRFNSSQTLLASGSDDGQLFLWEKNDKMVQEFGVEEEELAEFKECWYISKRLRSTSTTGGSEIYDLCWSPDDTHIVTASMDNTVRIFNVETGHCTASCSEHHHYAQGVAWDPLNAFIISQSADRSVNVYNILRDDQGSITGLQLRNKIVKGDVPTRSDSDCRQLHLDSTKQIFLFHNETLPSFFRRPALSPCGSLLCCPAGILKSCSSQAETNSEEVINAVHIFTRSSLVHNSNRPVLTLPFLKRPALVCAFNPLGFEITAGSKPYINLPYKLVFAVATSNEVLIYDTETIQPVSIIGNLHYAPLTDVSWSEDGLMLMVSSTDGFCSYVSIEKDLFGSVYRGQFPKPTPVKPLVKKHEEPKTSIVNVLPVRRKPASEKPDSRTNDSNGNAPKRRVQTAVVNKT